MVQISDLLAQISGAPSPISNDTRMSLPSKRKPEEQLRRPVDKLQKTGLSSTNSIRPVGQTSKPSVVDAPMSKMKLGAQASTKATSDSKSIGYKGSAQPRSLPPPASAAPKAAPKKGSFAEIMARAKVGQESLGDIGKISHKKIEKGPSRREREDLKTQKSAQVQKNVGPNGKFRLAGIEAIRAAHAAKAATPLNGSKATNGKTGKTDTPPVPEKKIKKAATATTGYTGTARPKPGGSNGSSKPSTSASASFSRYDRGPDRHRDERRANSGARYAYISDEEEDEEDEEDQRDYDSESDMEAAAFEVDDEEEQATRIARKEDAEALAEENRLKREKEEKKRRLTAMVKAKAKR